MVPLILATIGFGIYPKPMFVATEAALENLMQRNRYAVSAARESEKKLEVAARAASER